MSIEDKDLLLAEYAHFGDGIFKNEEIGERRIEFFVTIATAILGGVILLYTTEHPRLCEATTRKIALAALLSLFLLGLVTFARLLQRDFVTAEFKNIQDYLRERLRSRSVSLDDYVVPLRKPRPKLLRGGIATTTAVINSVVLAFLVAIWTSGNTVLVIPSFLLSFLIHAVAIVCEPVPKMRPVEAERSVYFRAGAGAVILNSQGQVLAMKRKQASDGWQLPQGGLKIGESPSEAVLREVHEETGIKKADLLPLVPESVLLAYELPPQHRKVKTGRGQVHHWFLFLYRGPETGISVGDGKEFEAWKWTSMQQLAAEVVPFRRSVYQELLRHWSAQLGR